MSGDEVAPLAGKWGPIKPPRACTRPARATIVSARTAVQMYLCFRIVKVL